MRTVPFSGAWRVVSLLLLLLSAGTLPAAMETDRARFAGRPLSDALAVLQAEGLRLIFSSDLVPRGIIVATEPAETSPRKILEELIRPHGLSAIEGPGGTLLIVEEDPPPLARGSIEGRVRTAGEGRPVPAAQVMVTGTEIATITGPDGKFSIQDIPAGKQTLEVKTAGLREQRFKSIEVQAGQVTQAILDLRVVPLLVEQIVVTPTRHEVISDRPESVRSLNADDTDRIPALGDDLSRAMAQLPGAAAGDKSAAFNLRGGETNETRVILDGLEIQEPFHLKDLQRVSGIVDARAIAMADVLSGGFPAEYGDSMSGVVDLATESPSSITRTSLAASNVNSRFSTQGTFHEGEGAWLASARAWYPDATLELVNPGGEEIAPSYYDLLGKTQFLWGEGSSISGNVLLARDRVDFKGEASEEATSLGYGSQYAWITLKSAPTSSLLSQTVISKGQIQSDRGGSVSGGSENAAQVADSRFFSFEGIKQDWSYASSDRHLLKFGLGARRLVAEYDYFSHAEAGTLPLDGTIPGSVTERRAALQESGLALGGYVAERFRLPGNLTAELGLRWDRQTYVEDSQISPRINLVYAPGAKSTLRVAWGRFSQSQGINELQVEDGVTEFFPAQHSQHWMVGFERIPSPKWRFRIDAYLKQMSDLRPRYENLLNPQELLPEVESDRVRVAPGQAEAKGVELFLEMNRGGRVSWWGSYALASVEDEIDGEWTPRSWDQRHTVNLGLSCRKGERWSFDASWLYHTGWPTTPVTATWATGSDGLPVIQATPGERNSQRYSPYHRLDVDVRRHFRLENGSLSLFLGVTNLYNRDNVCCVQSFDFHPQPGGRVDVDPVEGFWLEQIPQFGIVWEFAR
ncbi:MAG: TonB-dependent receptor [Acidobacteria bacterium]|nr:TonB-dependent receptor [Acidobacteriota bacterium]